MHNSLIRNLIYIHSKNNNIINQQLVKQLSISPSKTLTYNEQFKKKNLTYNSHYVSLGILNIYLLFDWLVFWTLTCYLID